MSIKKLPYNWQDVSAGDIISFRYKSKNKKSMTHTILVLNPFLVTKGQKKISTQLIGLKLEEANKIQLKITQKQIQIFEQIGEFQSIKADVKSGRGEGLYKLNIDRNMIQNDRKGVKPKAYDLLSKGLGITGAYRTYDYYKARRSSVYIEPIRLFTKSDIDDNKPQQPEKPQQPKKPEGGINENQL